MLSMQRVFLFLLCALSTALAKLAKETRAAAE